MGNLGILSRQIRQVGHQKHLPARIPGELDQSLGLNLVDLFQHRKAQPGVFHVGVFLFFLVVADIAFQDFLLLVLVQDGDGIKDGVVFGQQPAQFLETDPAGVFHSVAEHHDGLAAAAGPLQALERHGHAVVNPGAAVGIGGQPFDGSSKQLAIVGELLDLPGEKVGFRDRNLVVGTQLFGEIASGILDQLEVVSGTDAGVDQQHQLEGSFHREKS